MANPTVTKPTVTAAPDPTPALPTFEIAERRAQNGDLDALREVDADTLLVGQPCPMITRWINTGNGAPIGRFHKVMSQLGYVQVHRSELMSAPSLNGWRESPEGYVVRGEKGEEVLVKMPKDVYLRIQRRKAADRDVRRRSTAALKQKTAEQLGAEGQQQAADVVARMSVTEFQESSSSQPIQPGS